MQKKRKSRPRRIQLERKLLALAIAQGVATAAAGAVITVDDAGDSGGAGCTLRDAIASANGNIAVAGCMPLPMPGVGDDQIEFDPQIVPGTITLTNGQLDITGTLTLKGPGADRLTISGNNSSRIFAIDATGDVTIDGLTLTDGRESFGGAISNAGRLSLVDSVISSSHADASAGGAINHTGSTLTLIGSTLSNNTALLRGGGIYAAGGSFDETRLYRSTLSGNRTGTVGDGGGVYSKGGTLRTVNATLSGNTAGLGGGIRLASGTLRLTATIVADSTGGDCSLSGTLGTNSANLVEDGSCTAPISGDPALGPLGDNGGPTPTHALLPGSIAIDHPSSPTACVGGVDQRGATRPVDGDGDGTARCDTGAFEYLPALVVDTLALNAVDADCALPEAIENANDDALTHTDCPPGFEADTISFDPAILPGTITLAGLEMTIGSALTIQGPGADELTISADGFSRIFRISDGLGQRQVVNLSGLTLTGGNVAFSGGAITNSEDLTIVASTLSGNTANRGGAINNALGAVLSLSQSTLSGNSVSYDGGGVDNSGTVTATGSTLSGNTAERGGGLFNEYAGARATLTDSTLSGNTASIEGGGLFNSNLTSTVTLINSTLAGNSAAAGGGLFNEGGAQPGTISLTNTIIADSPGGGDCDNQGTIATNLTNLIEDGTCNPALTGDPLLGPLRDNAGPTQTHALLPGSPAIDAGDDTECLAADQRGNLRPDDGDDDGTEGCDIGAFELPQLLRVTTVAIDEADDGECSLPEAVANANADAQAFTGLGECPESFGPDLITFDPAILPGTITLAGTALTISSAVTIQGPGSDQVTISGGGASGILRLDDLDFASRFEVRIEGLTLAQGNEARPGYGGGAVYNREDVTINASVLTANSAEYGGAVLSDGSVTITDSLLSSNSAVRGGAIHNESAGTVTLTNSTLSANTADFAGGGVYSRLSSTLKVANSTLSGNSAGSYGGGLVLTGSAPGANRILANSTLVGNSAPNGGGLYNAAAVFLYNSVIAGSIAGADCVNAAVLVQLNNLFEDGSCSAPLTGDPLLGPLADNGGATLTHAPLPLSTLIDAGDDGSCPGTDQTGMPRPIDGDGDGDPVCDIGAFEFVDIFGPAASLNSAPDVTAAGATGYDLVIDYSDDAPIDLGRLDTGDVSVSGPGGPLVVSGFSPNGTGTTVTYTLTPPGGDWDVADNGTYTIDLNANEVFDTATTGTNAAAAAALGSFEVTIGAGGDAIFADGFEDPTPPPP